MESAVYEKETVKNHNHLRTGIVAYRMRYKLSDKPVKPLILIMEI